jgi:hypothetical protein
MTLAGDMSVGPGGMLADRIIGSSLQTIEVDKENDFFAIINSYVADNVSYQSSSTTPTVVHNSRIGNTVGTPNDPTIIGSMIVRDPQVGATYCGVGTSLTLDTIYYGNGQQLRNFPGMWVPRYFFGSCTGDNIHPHSDIHRH